MSVLQANIPVRTRPIPNASGYRISDTGQVWSCLSTTGMMTQFWHPRKPQLDKHGYLEIELLVDKNRRLARIHHLILEAFVGPCPEGMDGCHNDGYSLNNSVFNLRWDTRENNLADTIKHGRSLKGERNPRTSLNDADIIPIFEWTAEGLTTAEIAAKLGVRPSAINAVQGRRTWSHVQIPAHLEAYIRRPLGEGSKVSKLRNDDIIEIFKLSKSGLQKREIAEKYQVSKATISGILFRRYWHHVPIPQEFLPAPR